MSRPMHKLRRAVPVAIALGIGFLAAMVALPPTETPDQVAARAKAPAPKAVTAPVERLILIDKTVTRGVVESAGSVSYPAPSASSSTARVEIVKAPGAVVNAGDVLALIDGRPVIALQAEHQLGADVRPDSIGADLLLAQDALRLAGYQIPSGELGSGPATQEAIAAVYAKAGVRPASTATAGSAAGGQPIEVQRATLEAAVGAAELAVQQASAARAALTPASPQAEAQVASSLRALRNAIENRRAAVEAADDDLAAARTAVGSSTSVPVSVPGTDLTALQRRADDARRTGDQAVDDAAAKVREANDALERARHGDTAQSQVADAQVATASNALELARVQLANFGQTQGNIMPRTEFLFAPELPTVVLNASASTGPGGTDGSSVPLITLRSGELAVSATIPTNGRVQAGSTARAISDDGSVELEMTADGTGIGSTTDAIDARGQGTADVQRGTTRKFEVTRVVKGDVPIGLRLKVTIESKATEEAVLAVPITAVATLENESSWITLATGSGHRRVEVEVGAAGGGMVEIKPVGFAVRPGDAVVVG